jgi:hypothetical protein
VRRDRRRARPQTFPVFRDQGGEDCESFAKGGQCFVALPEVPEFITNPCIAERKRALPFRIARLDRKQILQDRFRLLCRRE